MQYLLDTNICVFILRQKFGVGERMLQAGVSNCFISELTYAELLYGAECSDNPEKNKTLIDLFPFQNQGDSYQRCHSAICQRKSPFEKRWHFG